MNKRNIEKRKEKALKMLKKLESEGYQAYIVGGFVRDLKLKRETLDIDITTNATPKKLREIFQEACLPKEEYGSITVYFEGIYFEITTFRKEIMYKDNRRPVEFKYIDNLEEDLLRRDFLMNTLCMDKTGKIIDKLGAVKDIEKKVIHTVGNANEKLKEDALRILRAIRFATVLNFKLSDEVRNAILEHKHLIKNLSYERKKQELEKIFTSPNAKYGINLIKELGLIEYLELKNLEYLTYYGDLCGIWTLLDTKNYPFTKNEKELMRKIESALLEEDLKNPLTLYKYDLYPLMVASDIRKLSKKEITKRHNHLPIHNRSDLEITTEEILKLLEIEQGPILKQIYEDLERQVLMKRLKNKNLDLKKYVVKHYKKC